MARHWYASEENVVHAFESRTERDEWATGPGREAIGVRDAERITVKSTALYVEYDGRPPEFWFRRFGPDWGGGDWWACNDLDGGRHYFFAI